MSVVETPFRRRLRRLGQVPMPGVLVRRSRRSRVRMPGAGRGVPRGTRRLHLMAALAALLLLLGCGWLWLRSSSLVAVRSVTITGVGGPDAPQIRHALAERARRMTTLNASSAELRAAVSAYPVVKALQVSTSFPHGMTIQVVEDVPVGTVQSGARTVVVDQSGQLLPNAPITPRLPAIQLPPGAAGLTAGEGAELVAVLAAAPYQMLPHVAWIRVSAGEGVVAGLRSGPQLVFGDASRLALKWAAADAVLASGSATAASYIDVTDPARPAAGSGQDTGVVTAAGASGGAGSTSSGGAGSSSGGSDSPGVSGNSAPPAAGASAAAGGATPVPSTSTGG